MDAKKFGAYIAELRKSKMMTQADLAKQLSVTDKAVSRWERGLGFPDINTLEPLAKALDISLVELMQSEKTENSDISDKTASQLMKSAVEISRKRSSRAKRTAVISIIIITIAAIIANITDKEILGAALTESLLFGLISWSLPMLNMAKLFKNHAVMVSGSFSFCTVSVLFQFREIIQRANSGDFAGIMDTIGITVFGVAVMMIVTIILNTVAIAHK